MELIFYLNQLSEKGGLFITLFYESITLDFLLTFTMEMDEIREYCLSLKGTTEGMKWGEHLCFMVGEKIYAVFGLDQTPVNASFKVSDEEFEEMALRVGMKPAPYFAKNK